MGTFKSLKIALIMFLGLSVWFPNVGCAFYRGGEFHRGNFHGGFYGHHYHGYHYGHSFYYGRHYPHGYRYHPYVHNYHGYHGGYNPHPIAHWSGFHGPNFVGFHRYNYYGFNFNYYNFRPYYFMPGWNNGFNFFTPLLFLSLWHYPVYPYTFDYYPYELQGPVFYGLYPNEFYQPSNHVLVSTNSPPGIQTWVTAKNGNIPPNAIVYKNNQGKLTYYCRATYKQHQYHGILVPKEGCYVQETQVTMRFTTYQVLVNSLAE